MKAILSAFAFLLGRSTAMISAAPDEDTGGTAACSLYLAQSTIANAGLGMFTGAPLAEDEYVGYGDLVIPVYDLDFHAGGSRVGEDYHWLLDEYTWSATSSGAEEMVDEAETVSAFATGFGSLPNCHLRLTNVDEEDSEYDYAGVPLTSPGTGAFSLYHNRSSYSKVAVDAGGELFVSYGQNYFTSREHDFGLVPLSEDYLPATQFMRSFGKLASKLPPLSHRNSSLELEEVMSDLLDIIQQSPYKSRPLGAIPKSFSVAKRAFEVGIQQTEVETSIRSLSYLEEHGKCLDNIRPAESSIAHAGRGAIATKFIPKGGYVSIAPLLHIPDRDVLIMYADKQDPQTGEESRDTTKPIGHQLLRNYCFGHNASSLLLCPYDPATPYINHDGQAPNAKITWAEDPAYNTASWRERPVHFFDNVWRGGLAFEYVALADIMPGDEVTIDYGPRWAVAWAEHVRRWRPPPSLTELVDDHALPLPTQDEDVALPDRNIMAWCRCSPGPDSGDNGVHIWRKRDMDVEEQPVLHVLERTQHPAADSYLYTVQVFHKADRGVYVVKDVPRKALSLSYSSDKYQSELFIKGVFRHEM